MRAAQVGSIGLAQLRILERNLQCYLNRSWGPHLILLATHILYLGIEIFEWLGETNIMIKPNQTIKKIEKSTLIKSLSNTKIKEPWWRFTFNFSIKVCYSNIRSSLNMDNITSFCYHVISRFFNIRAMLLDENKSSNKIHT